ncbi:MAG: hypothetical protein JO069_07400 [Verrucomicrobia bacterium]|nr:hypothetical protein [Verrucomicrobiota bacterium]
MLLALSFFLTFVKGDPRGEFHILGPGGGGAMFHPTISPHDEKTILVSCDMTGSYLTKNGGQSWRMFNLRGTTRFFVFDPKDPKVIYAQVNGLWRSMDGGNTWKLLYPPPRSLRGIQMSSDHADETILADPDPLGRITALAIDPADSQILYASAGKPGHAALFLSRNRGESWIRWHSLAEPALRIWALAPQQTSPPRLYIASPHSISLIANGPAKTFNGPDSNPITDISLGMVGDRQITLYAVAGGVAYVSSEDARIWRKCALPGTGAKVVAIAASLRHGQIAYLSYSGLRLGGATWMGVAKTQDAGRNWDLVWKQANTALPRVRDAWITSTFGPDWGDTPLMLGVAEQNPNLCCATDLGRTMHTEDGGKNWDAVYSRRLPGAGWQTTGLDVTTCYGIHFDPFNSRRQFISYTDIGLFRSEDGGHSWISSIAGVPREWWNTTYWVEFDPQVKGRMWSVHSGTHDLPRPKMWRHTSPASYLGGVCRSDDGGRTWTTCKSGMPESAVTHILLDPASPPSSRTLYAAAFGRGVYKSTDGGITWQLKNSGIHQKEPFAWRLSRALDGTLYLVVARRSENGRLGDDADGALYRSINGAETWSAVTLPAGVNGPNGLAIDPQSPTRLYLAAWARDSGMHGEGGGIFRSDDAGSTWRPVLQQDQHIYDVTIDPKNVATVYAAGFESSAWRSADSGEHWYRIPGFRFKWAHRVIPDPADSTSVYITTFGGSVWHGPANSKTVSFW